MTVKEQLSASNQKIITPNKTLVDIDTSGPDVEIELPEEKTQKVEEQPTEDKTYENERETKLEDGGSADDSSEKPVEQNDSEGTIISIKSKDNNTK